MSICFREEVSYVELLRDCCAFLTSNLGDQIFRFVRRHDILEFLPLNQERTEALVNADANHGSRSTGPANSNSDLSTPIRRSDLWIPNTNRVGLELFMLRQALLIQHTSSQMSMNFDLNP